MHALSDAVLKAMGASRQSSKLLTSGVATAALLTAAVVSTPASAYTLNGPLYTGVSEQMIEQKKAKEEAEKTEAQEIAEIEKTAHEKETEEIKELLAKGKSPMLLYGDNKLSRFLGCLNCTPDYYISIWNPESPFGSPDGHLSIWNMTNEYGSVVSKYSPWNLYGSNPPAIIDPSGKLYGFLTRNEQVDNRFNNNFADHLYYTYDLIRVDPKKWIKRFFAVSIIKGCSTITLDELSDMPKVVKKEDMLEPMAPQQNRRDDSKGRGFSFEAVSEDPDNIDHLTGGMDDSEELGNLGSLRPNAQEQAATPAAKTTRKGFNINRKEERAAQEALTNQRLKAIPAADSIHLHGREVNNAPNMSASNANAGSAAPAPSQGQANGQQNNGQQGNGKSQNSSGINGRDVHSLFQR